MLSYVEELGTALDKVEALEQAFFQTGGSVRLPTKLHWTAEADSAPTMPSGALAKETVGHSADRGAYAADESDALVGKIGPAVGKIGPTA